MIVLALTFFALTVFYLIAITMMNKARKKYRSEYDDVSDGTRKEDVRKIPKFPAVIIATLGVIFTFASCIFAQDAGEVAVLKNWGGSIAGHSEEAGFHIKAPYQDIVKYDTRNNVLSFMGNQEDEWFKGGSANGSAVTINDAGGASAKIDIQVNYSLDPSYAETLYKDYGSQENFVRAICAVDVRAVPREVAGKFDTIAILTNRGEFTGAIQDALAVKWEKYGLHIEQVSVQNVVYPETITAKYAEAQSAEIAKATAQNNQKVAEVEAQTKITIAEGEAEANRILNESLTPEVIQQHYIEALTTISENGDLIVVPEGTMTVVNTSK